MVISALSVFISTNRGAYNGWNRVWIECFKCIKWEKLSYWYFVLAALKILWGCEVTGAIEMSTSHIDLLVNGCWKNGPADVT